MAYFEYVQHTPDFCQIYCYPFNPNIRVLTLKKKIKLGLRDGSLVNSTGCSSRDLEFKSQQLCGGLPLATMLSDSLLWCV